MVGPLGCALLCLVLAACFQKNFLDHSDNGRRTGTRTAMPAACCLIPEEEKSFSEWRRRIGTRTAMPAWREADWDAYYVLGEEKRF